MTVVMRFDRPECMNIYRPSEGLFVWHASHREARTWPIELGASLWESVCHEGFTFITAKRTVSTDYHDVSAPFRPASTGNFAHYILLPRSPRHPSNTQSM